MSDNQIQLRKEREAFMENCKFETPEEVARLFLEYTKVIWDHKMVGRIYDYYGDDCIVHREGGMEISGIQNVFTGTLGFQASFPDLKFTFVDIFAEGNPEDGYKFGQALYYEGTNTGYSAYGPPTGKKLTEDVPCIALCECLVKKVEGRWKIVEEWLVRPNRAFDETLTTTTEGEENAD